MQKIITCVLFLIAATSSFCQETNPAQPMTREAYLTKSKNQKTAARVLLIGGGAVMVTAIAIAAPGNTSFDNLGTLVTIAAIGGIAALGSIPLFIASKRNKKKAMAATANLKFEKISSFLPAALCFHSYPALSVKINL